MPVVNIRVPGEIYQEIARLAQKRDTTLVEAARLFFFQLRDTIDQLEQENKKLRAELEKAHALLAEQEKELDAYKKKVKQASKFTAGTCWVCGKPLHWDLTNAQDLDLLKQVLSQSALCHWKCQEG